MKHGRNEPNVRLRYRRRARTAGADIRARGKPLFRPIRSVSRRARAVDAEVTAMCWRGTMAPTNEARRNVCSAAEFKRIEARQVLPPPDQFFLRPIRARESKTGFRRAQ